MSVKNSPALYTCDGCGITEFQRSSGGFPENWVIVSFDLFKKEDYCPKCWGAMKGVIEMHYGKEDALPTTEKS